jgi:hypothetical protein
MDMLGVPMGKLSVHMYKSYDDMIYVFITLVAHGPCTHRSHHAGIEYFNIVDCSTGLYTSNSTWCRAEQKTRGNHIFSVLLYGRDLKRKRTPYVECMENLPRR